MNILIVDDHALFRHGLTLTLSELFDAAEVVQAGNIDQALQLAGPDSGFDLALADLVMPGVEGVSGLRRIVEHLEPVPVVVVSSSEDPDDVRDALASGARGYVPKSAAAELLQHALPLVLSGEIYVPPIALGVGAPARPVPTRPAAAELQPADAGTGRMSTTPRQAEVLALLVQGLSNKEIARTLSMPESTVKVHVKAILQKLGVKNRTQAAIVAVQQGLVDSAPAD